MEFYHTIGIIRKHIWLVVLATMVATGSAAIVDRLHRNRTTYIATATLFLNPNVPNRGLLGPNPANDQSGRIDMQTLVATYDAYFRDPNGAAAAVLATIPLGMTKEQLASATSTGYVPNTLIYNINVTGYDRHQINAAADALARNFIAIDQGKQLSSTDVALNHASSSYFKALIDSTKLHLLHVLISKRLALTPVDQYSQVVALQNQLSSLQDNEGKTNSAANPAALYTANYVGMTPASVLARSALARNAVLFAALGGLIIGVALALLREYLDSSLRSAEEVAELLSLPVLATISTFRRATWRDRRKARGVTVTARGGDATDSLITLNDPFHTGSEAFRNLRTGILFAAAARNLQTIVITSASPKEGKSVIAANLSIMMAQAGSRVILVDADMRRPMQHTLFGLPGTTGLSGMYLADENNLESAVESALKQTAVTNLRVIPAGAMAPNPAELLASARTAALIAAIKEHADVVIFDTPPMALLTDAVILSTHADGTVLVVRAGATRRDVIAAARAKLSSVNARVLGAVLNMADLPHTGYGRYYYRRDQSTPAQSDMPRAAATIAASAVSESKSTVTPPFGLKRSGGV